jgi:hypothetical protein
MAKAHGNQNVGDAKFRAGAFEIGLAELEP